ncbi:class I SAM-dependent methyltransferase [Rhodococcus sp. NPDC058521]|uniref:class I SAM-dependent methyltransferase n=1 Tax=Rhodococcus sp. NPDC058521 TaxID=3346536 RepID=UPI00365F8C00
MADANSGRALDVGCGEGADARWLADRGWKVMATDISAVAPGVRRHSATDPYRVEARGRRGRALRAGNVRPGLAAVLSGSPHRGPAGRA